MKLRSIIDNDDIKLPTQTLLIQQQIHFCSRVEKPATHGSGFIYAGGVKTLVQRARITTLNTCSVIGARLQKTTPPSCKRGLHVSTANKTLPRTAETAAPSRQAMTDLPYFWRRRILSPASTPTIRPKAPPPLPRKYFPDSQKPKQLRKVTTPQPSKTTSRCSSFFSVMPSQKTHIGMLNKYALLINVSARKTPDSRISAAANQHSENDHDEITWRFGSAYSYATPKCPCTRGTGSRTQHLRPVWCGCDCRRADLASQT